MSAPSPSPPLPVFATAGARRLAGLCGLLLFLATLALNLRVVDFGFLYLRDDDVNVTVNPFMGGLGAARLHWMFTNTFYVRRYIPLGWLNFSATYEWAGLHPLPYHAVGLALAAVDAALVFAVLVLGLRRFTPAGAAGVTRWGVAAAALAAGWWAFHPLRVETTAWVSGNLYGQALAFLFAGLWSYLESGLAAGRRRTGLLLLAAAAYAASLLTYPVALGVPFLLVGLDWVESRARPQPTFRRLLAEKLLFFVPLAGALAVTVSARFASSAVFGAVPDLGALPLAERAAQSAYVAAYYLWKPWWPFELSPLYDTLAHITPWSPVFLASMAAVVGISVYAGAALRRRPLVAALWFGYLAVAAPYFGLTEKPHIASDRYAAILTALAAAVLAGGLARLPSRGLRAAAGAAALALLAGLGVLTWRQQEIWRSDQGQHRYVTGFLHDREMLENFTSRLLILEFMRGNEDAATAAVAAGLRANPASPSYRHAADLFREKRRVEPYYGGASFLAIIQEQTGVQFAREGQYREANDHFEDALELDDHFYQAAYDRALVLLRLGRCGEALGSFFLAERWATPALTPAQRTTFLTQLEAAAAAQGDQRLAEAAGRQLRR